MSSEGMPELTDPSLGSAESAGAPLSGTPSLSTSLAGAPSPVPASRLPEPLSASAKGFGIWCSRGACAASWAGATSPGATSPGATSPGGAGSRRAVGVATAGDAPQAARVGVAAPGAAPGAPCQGEDADSGVANGVPEPHAWLGVPCPGVVDRMTACRTGPGGLARPTGVDVAGLVGGSGFAPSSAAASDRPGGARMSTFGRPALFAEPSNTGPGRLARSQLKSSESGAGANRLRGIAHY